MKNFLLSFFTLTCSLLISKPTVFQLSYSGSGSHLLNLYVAKLLNTDIHILGSNGIKPYSKYNELFQLTHNPDAPRYFRTHTSRPIHIMTDRESKLIFVLRDYKECFFHQMHNEQFSRGTENQIARFPKNMEEYFQLLQFYHDYKGKKLLVHYESLLQDPLSEIARVATFLDKDEVDIPSFVREIDQLKKTIYKLYPGTSRSRGKSATYHQDAFRKPMLMRRMETKVAEKYPKLHRLYLCRYKR